ncbi:MAG: hypothetical protein DVB31_04355 [Verrucomicrobia bacterium]|nr:MAG: hypothetical protein DVB31_04355 [Verrucomicrobiota bacterium]
MRTSRSASPSGLDCSSAWCSPGATSSNTRNRPPVSNEPTEPPTAVSSLGRVARLVLATLSNRTELLLVEAQEERQRLLQALLLVAILVTAGTLSLVVVTFTVVAVLWEQRVPTLVVLSLVYIAATTVAFFRLRRQMRGWQAFGATIDELQKDREWLKENP